MKGPIDIILSNEECFIVGNEASKKRCGGMGDTLAGLIGVYVNWGNIYGLIMAGIVNREAGKRAYEKEKMGTTGFNLITEISGVFNDLFLKDLKHIDCLFWFWFFSYCLNLKSNILIFFLVYLINK